jgi:hypothetical protein
MVALRAPGSCIYLSSLTGQRNVLSETHARLAKELANVQELGVLGARYKSKCHDLDFLDEVRRTEYAEQVDHWDWLAGT